VLYLDSSALIKHYQKEPGTEALEGRLQMEAESSRSVFTSALTYAEIHATLARRTRKKLLSLDEAALVHDRFDTDWVLSLSLIELGVGVLGFVPAIVKAHPLRGADAVQLASALWLRDTARLSNKQGQQEAIVFGSSDRQLVTAAQKYNLDVFNPEIT
jgi:predicted nucleic acid-binding protein